MTRRRIGVSLVADAYDFSDFPAALDEAEALGLDFVELPLFALHLVAAGRVLDDRVAALAAVLAGRRLAFSAHGFLDVNLAAAPDALPAHEAVAAAMVTVAARLGVDRVVFHAGRLPAGTTAVEAAAAAVREVDALRRLGARAADAGVLVAIENVFRWNGRVTASPAELAARLAAVDHPAVAACFDVGHGAIAATEAGLDLDAETAALAPLARHVHVHDNFGRPAPERFFHPSEALAFGAGDLHLPLGRGALPWERLLAAGFPADAWFDVELNARYWPELTDTVARLRALLAAAP